MQKILVLTTYEKTLRAKVIAYEYEDGGKVEKHVKLPYEEFWRLPQSELDLFPATPVQAMGDNWNLMTPPTTYQSNSGEELFDWWFQKS